MSLDIRLMIVILLSNCILRKVKKGARPPSPQRHRTLTPRVPRAVHPGTTTSRPRTPRKKSRSELPEWKKRTVGALQPLITLFPFLVALFVGLNAMFMPILKWAALKLAARRVESEDEVAAAEEKRKNAKSQKKQSKDSETKDD